MFNEIYLQSHPFWVTLNKEPKLRKNNNYLGRQRKYGVSNENTGSPMKIWESPMKKLGSQNLGVPNEKSMGVSNERGSLIVLQMMMISSQTEGYT